MAQSDNETVKRTLDEAKALMKAGKHDKAIALVRTLNHPNVPKWIAQLESRKTGTMPAFQPVKSTVEVPDAKVGFNRTMRWITGILALLSLLWICYGVSISGQAFQAVVSTPVNAAGFDAETADALQTAGIAGAGLGAGLGMTFFVCSGLPFALFFGFLFWRNGTVIARKREHDQTLRVLAKR